MSDSIWDPIAETPDDERAFEAMLEGYADRMTSQGMPPETVSGRISFLRKLRAELSLPGAWEMGTWERWAAGRLRDGAAETTLRADRSKVSGFFAYLNSVPRWVAWWKHRYGRPPICPVDASNGILHRETVESGSEVRPWTREEARAFFAYADDLVEHAADIDCNEAVLYRDNVLLKDIFAMGLRRQEPLWLRREDGMAHPEIPEFGDWGGQYIAHGKAKARGGPRPRTVYTTDLTAWIVPVLEQYAERVRPLLPASPLLFPTLRGGRIGKTYVSHLFARLRDGAGLDPVLTTHSMRRAFATFHVEAGYPVEFVSAQLGHELESSILRYVFLSDEYRESVLRRRSAGW